MSGGRTWRKLIAAASVVSTRAGSAFWQPSAKSAKLILRNDRPDIFATFDEWRLHHLVDERADEAGGGGAADVMAAGSRGVNANLRGVRRIVVGPEETHLVCGRRAQDHRCDRGVGPL